MRTTIIPTNKDYNLSLDDIKSISKRRLSLISADNKSQLNRILKSADRTGNNRYILIHYQTSNDHHTRYGHWAAMIIKPRDRVINYFDSYGYYPDDQLEQIPDTYRHLTRQNHRDIGNFLYKAIKFHGYTVDYNDHPLQKMSRRVSTCGRYCALFLYLDCSPDQFFKTITYYKNHLHKKSFDDTVVSLTTK